LRVEGPQAYASGTFLVVNGGSVTLASNVGAAATSTTAATATLGLHISSDGTAVVLESDQVLASLAVNYASAGTQSFDLASPVGGARTVRVYAADLAAARRQLNDAVEFANRSNAANPLDGFSTRLCRVMGTSGSLWRRFWMRMAIRAPRSPAT
jgi:hypothetical protein